MFSDHLQENEVLSKLIGDANQWFEKEGRRHSQLIETVIDIHQKMESNLLIQPKSLSGSIFNNKSAPPINQNDLKRAELEKDKIQDYLKEALDRHTSKLYNAFDICMANTEVGTKIRDMAPATADTFRLTALKNMGLDKDFIAIVKSYATTEHTTAPEPPKQKNSPQLWPKTR